MMPMPWEKAKAEAAQQSGMEKMLRSMGLGEVLDMAKQLANAGTAQKIIAFADNLEPLMQRLERMERTLERIAHTGTIQCNECGGSILLHSVEPDTSARQPEPASDADSGFIRQSEPTGDVQRSSGNGTVHPNDGNVHSGTAAQD